MRSIVIFTNTLMSGGAEKQALLLAISLKERHNVLLVVYDDTILDDRYVKKSLENNLQVIYLQGNILKKVFQLFKILRKDKVFAIFSYLLTTNLAGAIAGRLAGVPHIIGGIRNAKLDKKKLPVQKFINNVLSTHTIYNNFAGVIELQNKGFNIEKAAVIPNCFELTTQRITRPAPAVISIITVGRFVDQKGFFEALKIMKALKDLGINFFYYMVGYGELEQALRQEVQNLNLQDHVQITINPSNLNEYYEKSDVYLCTSFFEGLSNTIMEALSFCLPVIATNVGDNDRLVTDGVNGFLIPEVRHDLFIQPLKTLMDSPEIRNRMGLESYRIIRDKYSGSAFKNNYLAFINDLADQGNKTA